jgi:hypothetical protein
MMGTGRDTVSAAYTEVVVYGDFFPRAVITVFYGARGNTGMTIYAFFLINPDNRR